MDSIVGRDRLPTFATPPVFRMCKQSSEKKILCYRPALTFLILYVATKEDWYEGIYIPKGTICIANAWHCNHDREVFGDDADEFRPERHLDENGEIFTRAGRNKPGRTCHW